MPSELVERVTPSYSSQASGSGRLYQNAFYQFRTNPYGRGRRVKEAEAASEYVQRYAYEDEDQSTGMNLRPGMRVRHPQFGVGSVVSIEPLDDDTKLVVRFATVGRKTLRARYARLARA